MRPLLLFVLMTAAMPVFAEKNIIYDDGSGAQISFSLPTREIKDGQIIEYRTYRISVRKNGKFLLLTDLAGSKTKDGITFEGTVIIPSAFIDSAEIIMLGSPPNSSLGVVKTVKVSTFKTVHRAKSWTDQN